jgi:hypothetical protein
MQIANAAAIQVDHDKPLFRVTRILYMVVYLIIRCCASAFFGGCNTVEKFYLTETLFLERSHVVLLLSMSCVLRCARSIPSALRWANGTGLVVAIGQPRQIIWTFASLSRAVSSTR